MELHCVLGHAGTEYVHSNANNHLHTSSVGSCTIVTHPHFCPHSRGFYTSSLVKLSEDEIPDFQNFWVVFIDELGHVSVSDAVIVDLRARTTWTKLSHLPEIVFHAKRQHTMLRNSVW